MRVPKFVAEIGKTHNGSYKAALESVLAARDAGFDLVKFQYYSEGALNPQHNRYQELLEKRLTSKEMGKLKQFTEDMGMEFSCSLFSKKDIGKTDSDIIKIPSTFYEDQEFVNSCLEAYDEVHASTGFLEKVSPIWRHDKLVTYACTSLYPSLKTCSERIKEINNKSFRSGFSYHGTGYKDVVFACALEPEFVEVHFSGTKEPTLFEYSLEQGQYLISECKRVISNSVPESQENLDKSFVKFKGEFV